MAKRSSSYYDYHGFVKRRYSHKQRAAYWKKKYLDLIKQMRTW